MLTLDDLRRFLEHAPPCPTIAEGLRGWRVEIASEIHPSATRQIFVCADCAGRIMARGCSIGSASPVWTMGDGECEVHKVEPPKTKRWQTGDRVTRTAFTDIINPRLTDEAMPYSPLFHGVVCVRSARDDEIIVMFDGHDKEVRFLDHGVSAEVDRPVSVADALSIVYNVVCDAIDDLTDHPIGPRALKALAAREVLESLSKRDSLKQMPSGISLPDYDSFDDLDEY